MLGQSLLSVDIRVAAQRSSDRQTSQLPTAILIGWSAAGADFAPFAVESRGG
jgi:hypothetical protein